MNEIKLSISIVNYNQKYFPRLCVESILQSVGLSNALQQNDQTKKLPLYEILVCDNNSSDESLDYLREAEKKKILRLTEAKKNLGYGAGHNLALKEARGEYVLILNTDVTLEKDTLQKSLNWLEKKTAVGILGAKLVYHNGEIQPSCRRDFSFLDLLIKRSFLRFLPFFKKRFNRYLMKDFYHNTVQEVDLVTGAFMLMPKTVFTEVGGFDERYFLFMEDFDLCKKVRKQGKKVVYFPEASAVHYHKRLTDGGFLSLFFKRTFWLHCWSALQFHWKWR